MPNYIITTDLIYDAEQIPTIGIEQFFLKNGHLRSWHIDAGYQVHYNDQFGIIFDDGDVVSIGVYQGPVAKLGYSYYTKWHNRKWMNYFSPTLGVKYLWYDPLRVNTDPHLLNTAHTIQSEKCVALVPQVYFGQKRNWGHFSFDYYFGVQLPVKFRDKTIYLQEDNYGTPNPNVPYTSYQVSPNIDLVFGIKLGYIKTVPLPDNQQNIK